jgi:tRNA(fMet)-specific endonuclease VapC
MLVDTDVLSAILKRHADASARFSEHIALFGRITWSVITSYEVLRGMRWKRAAGQERVFSEFLSQHEVLPLTADIADVAAHLHADAKTRGITVSDADTLIAATALVHGIGVATGNVRHFCEFSQLHLENWLVP